MKTLLALLLMVTPAFAQDFVPFTIDAAQYRQIDDTMAQVSMPRQAHIQWQQLWQRLEQQALQEKAQAEVKGKK